MRGTLEDSCVRGTGQGIGGGCLTLPLIDSILIAITGIANTVVQCASPKPTFMSLEISLVSFSLRIEFSHDGGSIEDFFKNLERKVRTSATHSRTRRPGPGNPVAKPARHRIPSWGIQTGSLAGPNCAKPSRTCSSSARTMRIATASPPC